MKQSLKIIYEMIKHKEDELNSYFTQIDEDILDDIIIKNMYKITKLKLSKENTLALIIRLVSLREDSVIEALKQEGHSEVEIEEIMHQLYHITKDFHLSLQRNFIQKIERNNLLSPFYMRLVWGVYEVGEILSQLQSDWTRMIIQTTNKDLLQTYKSDEKVIEFLDKNQLFQYDKKGKKTDRSYSVLIKNDGKYIVKPYIKAFPKLKLLGDALDGLIEKLSHLEDKEYHEKDNYIAYFKALKKAFLQEDNAKLLVNWQEVDRAWMRVSGPVQVGHPFEYYEDHYRKAVAFEWDIRLDAQKSGKVEVKKDILKMYKKLYFKLQKDKSVYKRCVENVKRVQLHIGRPMLYFAAEFNGLFSAQVVPNDESVTKEYGKKIFAFADNVLDSARSRPFLKIHKDVFGSEFLNQSREILFKRSDIWYKVYELSTIGHEFGHILWLDFDTEQCMNKSGVFKNIEEFKATSSGLVAFFLRPKEELKTPMMIDLIKRSVTLISWMKTGEVEPYYCEGLVHLSLLFDAKVLRFKGKKLHIDMSENAYEQLKEAYARAYKNLASCYLAKKDAKKFLDKYASKNDDGLYMPVSKKVKKFVEYYWDLHQNEGRVIDESEDRDKWLN